MQRLGLALSGGGFRASLYHLGVIRFLRDAQILPRISHITSVSGGSVMGAHLVLNWDKYCGSEDEFQQVADEFLQFLQMDVRNRILRRFPLASLANGVRRAVRLRSLRQYTRAGLLERHYERFLFGDTSLFQLPEWPRLHILATNVSEGSLCAFFKGGLLQQRRLPGGKIRFEQVDVGLATVPMAVAASSAFPGFFPPLQLRSQEVGANEGDFSTQAFTDGGIYDNLGLRMFRLIEQSSVGDIAPFRADDVLEPDALVAALASAQQLPNSNPLRHLAEKLIGDAGIDIAAEARLQQGHPRTTLLDGLSMIMDTAELYRDSVFHEIELGDPGAQSLFENLKSSSDRPRLNDQMWLNRVIIEATFQQAIGKPCFRATNDQFDSILVSNAGATLKVRADGRAEGLLKTAMRSSSILMDRVDQLELESFRDVPGVLFLPITQIVEPSQDQHAPHPEIQRHAAQIRTDLDRFSDLEIATLVQHGYCVARQACRSHSLLQDSDIQNSPPWNPLVRATNGRTSEATNDLSDASRALQVARQLQRSASRRFFSTFLNFRDWPTYFWVTLVAIVMLSIPFVLYKMHRTTQQQGYVLSAIAETSPLYRKILGLLDQGPVHSIPPVVFADVESIEPPDFTGFEILTDDRIIDLRGWTVTAKFSATRPFIYSRLRLHRTEDGIDNSHLRFQLQTVDEQIGMICRNEGLKPRYSRMKLPNGTYLWELDLDLSHVSIGASTEAVLDEMLASDLMDHSRDAGRFRFTIAADTVLVRIWILMPEGRTFDHFEIKGFPIDQPEKAQVINPTTTVELPIGSIVTFQLINPRHEFRYECSWNWSDVED
jgi:predicted acylesterase/phospholipase RssA